GMVPGLVLCADLAGRFGAGLGVWHDIVLMVADGQIGTTLTLLSCLVAGSGVAIVALAGRLPKAPARQAPEMRIEGEISVRRREPEPEPPGAAEPDEEEPVEPEPAEEPGRDRPGRPQPRPGGAPPPLVEAARLELAPAGPPQGHPLALAHVADLGQDGAGVRHGLHRGGEALPRDRDQELEVLTSGGS